MNNIATKIMVNRKKLGLSQTELAEKLNVSNKLISKWETGTSLPATEYLPKLCKALNIGINELLGEEDIEPPKSNRDTIVFAFILAGSFILFTLTILLTHFAIRPAMFKNYYLGKIQDKLENNFNSSVVQCSTTVEVDDVPTTINQYMFVEDGVVEYHETGEDEKDETIIKDGVKYTGSKMYRETFNKDINNTFDLYKYMSGEDEGINFLTDNDMITYVRKQFNGYYIEIDRATMNKFIANEVNSSFRITSKIKGDIDLKKDKLEKLELEFEGKVNAAPFKVKVTLNFNINPKKQEVQHPEDAYTLTWMSNNVVNLKNLNNEKVQKLNLEGDEIKFSNNNVLITYDETNFYIYDSNLNLTKTIESVETYYSSPNIIYVDNLLYQYERYSDYDFFVHNLNNNTYTRHKPKGTFYEADITRIIPTENPNEVYIFWTNNDIDLYNIETQTIISTINGQLLYTDNDDIYLYRTLDDTNLSNIYKLNNNVLSLVYENIELNHNSYYSYYLYNNKLYLGNKVCERDFTNSQYIYNFNGTISFIENDLIFYTNGQILDLNDLYQPGIQTYSTNNIISLNNHYIIDTGDGFFKVEKSFITDYFN